MANPYEEEFDKFFQASSLAVNAQELAGEVKVLDRDSLMALVQDLVGQAEDKVKMEAAEGAGMGQMIDDYMRQNADLKQREREATQRAQDAEIQLQVAQQKINELEQGGGGGEGAGGMDPEPFKPFLEIDASKAPELLEYLGETLTELESALIELEDAEGHWEMIRHVADMKADLESITEDLNKAAMSFQGLFEAIQSGSGSLKQGVELVEAACEAKEGISKLEILKKSVDFLMSMLHPE